MSDNGQAKSGEVVDPADELKKQESEEPTTGAVSDGPSSADQVGEKPLIAPGKSGGL
jgi:hypothetical protein